MFQTIMNVSQFPHFHFPDGQSPLCSYATRISPIHTASRYASNEMMNPFMILSKYASTETMNPFMILSKYASNETMNPFMILSKYAMRVTIQDTATDAGGK